MTRLKQVGEWMNVNHDAIYGTQASPFSYLPWGRATMKGQKLYLHILSWPENGLLKVPIQNKVLHAALLANPGSDLSVAQKDDHVEIKVPADAPDSLLSIMVLEIEGDPQVLPVPSAGKTGTASSVDSTCSVANLFDGDPKNAWKPALGETSGWVEVDLGEDVNIESFSVAEPWRPWNNHGQEFTLQYKKNGEWLDVVSGKTNGCGHTQPFGPVSGRYFRLNISGAKGESPVLNEWILNRAI